MQYEFEFYRNRSARPVRPERLFFCAFPDKAASNRVSEFAERFIRENRLNGNQISASRLHISLHHVRDDKRLRSKFVYAAQRAADSVFAHPFDVTFPSIASFEPLRNGAPRRPLVLLGGGNALFGLHEVLGAAMEKNGLKAAKSFTPHMTLIYGSKPIPLQAIEPIRFAIKEFALVHSELWLTRYNILGRWKIE